MTYHETSSWLGYDLIINEREIEASNKDVERVRRMMDEDYGWVTFDSPITLESMHDWITFATLALPIIAKPGLKINPS